MISLILVLAGAAYVPHLQPAAQPQPVVQPAKPASDLTPAGLTKARESAITAILKLQEGENKDQWPYEGVYRVGGKIPFGYRVGGTAIVVEALVTAPGYVTDKARQEAVARSVKFICEGRNDPQMSEKDYDAGYDVRGWGYIQGLRTLCILKRDNAVPEGLASAVNDAAAWYCDALQKIEIPESGGWNYARPAGRTKTAPASPFMTPPALEALFLAKSQGLAVDAAVVTRALDALERCRNKSGSMQYAGPAQNGRAEATPGAVGRMCATESVLMLAGRGGTDRARGAVDAFIVHWKWLDQRRAKPGTHEGPYAIAPYYFMYAHRAAAEAVELLPTNERAEYRKRINELMFSVRADDGSWNDRHFPRSAGYGTAMAVLAMSMPEAKPAAKWEPAK